MKKKIQQGQVWLARSVEMPGSYWVFEIIASITDKGSRFFVGIKRNIPEPDGQYLHMFDEYGREVTGIPIMYFELYRKTKRKSRYAEKENTNEKML